MRICLLTYFSLLVILFQSIIANGESYVRKIDIVRLNVFDRQLENDDNFVYRLANKLHIVTRERVVRRELLLRTGDYFDREALEQSVRNIRTLPFIGEVEVAISNASEDSVDITIITEDLWTTVLGVSSEGGGGLYSVSLYADEKNIAGLGIGTETNLTFTSDENNGFSIHVFDYRFLESRFVADFWLCDFSYNDEVSLLLYRPFYSVDTRWSFSCMAKNASLRPRLFFEGEEF